MTQLTKYDAARYALSAAVQVDEVKDIRDKALAMAAYAKQAKDTELVKWATEIRVRAERRAGQMLAEMEMQNGGHAAKARSTGSTELPKTLSELGITKNESSRWQKLAAVSDNKFESAVAAAREVAGEVTAAAIVRAEQGTVATPRTKPEVAPVIDVTPDYTELDAAHDQIQDLQADLVVARIASTDSDEQKQAAGLIAELRAEIKILETVNRSLTMSRDSCMNEVAQLKKQCEAQKREIAKLKL